MGKATGETGLGFVKFEIFIKTSKCFYKHLGGVGCVSLVFGREIFI